MNYSIEEINQYSPKLLTSIKSLVSQLDRNFQELTEADLKAMISSPSTHLYVAVIPDTGEIVGMVTLVVYRIPYKMKAQLEDIVVDQAYRGHGIGTKLMEYVVEEAKRFGVKSLNFTSSPKRESANHLYERLGFEKRDTNVYRKDLS